MFEALSVWFHATPAGEFLLTMLVSMAPVLELRGGVPFGVALGLPLPAAFLAGVLGNLIPVPFVILFIRRVFRWVRRNVPALGSFVDRVERRAYAKIKSGRLVRYQAWGLLLFVAVPLPGTGAWTGSLIAALMDLRLKNAVPVIALGVVIAGLITTAVTYGLTALL